jgi:lipid II:glycine glycyltransferase (peptidoglycan interpeptide bridge formation enzyme)
MTPTARVYDQPADQTEWDALLASAPQGHVLQSWAWGALKDRFGWRVQRIGAGPALCQVLYWPLPAGLGTLAYVPKGPAIDLHSEAMPALLDALRPLLSRQRAICLKIEPNRADGPSLAERLRFLGFRPSPQTVQPRRTLLVDLDGDPDALLGRMKQKTRYNIRLAARRGVTVRAAGQEDLAAFYELMETTADRDEFGIHSRAYYEAVYRLFVPDGRGCFLLAEHEGSLLAALVVVAFGDVACYMYGASSNERRNLMPTYLLQWEAMLWAKEQGCGTYDLWGVPDQDEDVLEEAFMDRSDGLWGVYRFKRGFGGRLERSIGAWDLVYAPLRYKLYEAAIGLYNRRQGA